MNSKTNIFPVFTGQEVSNLLRKRIQRLIFCSHREIFPSLPAEGPPWELKNVVPASCDSSSPVFGSQKRSIWQEKWLCSWMHHSPVTAHRHCEQWGFLEEEFSNGYLLSCAFKSLWKYPFFRVEERARAAPQSSQRPRSHVNGESWKEREKK